MKGIFFIIALLFFNAYSYAADIDYGVGVGLKYSVVGGQVALRNGPHKAYATLGVLSIGAGYDYSVSERIDLGASWTYVDFLISAPLRLFSLNATYSESFSKNKSFSFNIGPIYYKDDNDRNKIGASFGFGVDFH